MNFHSEVKDILREMRERCVDEKHSPNLWEYLDRIEAAHEREDSTWRNAVLDFCNAFTMVYEPPFKDCPAMLSGAFLELCDKLGIEQVKIGGEDGK